MDVILLERVANLGQMGDVVTVKPGYARNYLLPERKALRATKANLAFFEKQKATLEATNLKRKQEAEAVGKKLDGLQVVIIRQAAETGQLYGSVAARDVADAVIAAGYKIERRQVVLNQAIKELGIFPIEVALHPEVSVTVTANVARTEDEAKVQAQSGEALIVDRNADREQFADLGQGFDEDGNPRE